MKTPASTAALLLAAAVSLAACSGSPAPDPPAQPATPDAARVTAASSTEEAVAPRPPVPEHLREGQRLYDYWCAACHAAGPGHPGTQALEARYAGAMPGALEERTNLAPEFVAIFVRNGISVMPFFRKTEINDEELAAIGAYLARTPPTQQAPQAP